jgi:hypothetical protein
MLFRYKFAFLVVILNVFKFWCVCIISSCLSVCVYSACLSVRMQQLGSHWTDFHELWYLSVLRKCVDKIQVSMKPDNNKYLTWKPIYMCDNTSHSSSEKDKRFRQNANSHCMLNNVFLKSGLYDTQYFGKIWYGPTDHTWQYGACALHAGYLVPQIDTQNM